MMLKIAEVFLENGDVELIFDELIKKEDFKFILDRFTEIEGVKIIRQTEDEVNEACLLSNGKFEFVLVYQSDSFVWNYVYAVKKENHHLLRKLCEEFAIIVSS